MCGLVQNAWPEGVLHDVAKSFMGTGIANPDSRHIIDNANQYHYYPEGYREF
jgi:hypothetical protein